MEYHSQIKKKREERVSDNLFYFVKTWLTNHPEF